jgi:hypothetical protein
MKRICVFCGSSEGSRPEYHAAAEEMGAELVRRNIGLVYGGGNVGLMGIIADAVLAQCTGVLHSIAGDARPCRRAGVPQAGEPGAGASGGIACRLAASTGGVASRAGGEMDQSGDEVKSAK